MKVAIRLYRTYKNLVSPHRFLLRRSISRFGSSLSPARAFSQCVDIGGGTSPLRATIVQSFKVDRYWSLDIAPSDVTDIVADAGALPLADDSVDLILCIEVLQHIRDYVRVLDEMVRVLRLGGLMIVTFPFIYGECDVQDFRRWILFGMMDELERAGCTVINAEPRGGAAFATVACWSSAFNNLVPGGRDSWRAERSMKGYFRVAFLEVLGLPLTVLRWVAIALDKMLPRSGVYMGGIVVAAKVKVRVPTGDQ